MALSIYIDEAKTKRVFDVKHFVCDGVKNEFIASYNIAYVYLDNYRCLDCTITANIVKLNSVPIGGTIISLIPEDCLDFYLDAALADTATVELYVETTSSMHLLSEDFSKKVLGPLLFSLNGVDFHSCIQFAGNETITVKYSAPTALNDIVTYAYIRVLAVESDTTIDTTGAITNSITPGAGEEGGVEIYEIYI